jgi:AAA ATPase domain
MTSFFSIETLRLGWTLRFDRPEALTITDPSAQRTKIIARSKGVEISGQVQTSGLGPIARSLSYRLGDDLAFTLTPKRTDENAFDLKATGGAFRFIRTPGRAWQLPGPIKSYAFPDQARTYFQNASFPADLERDYETQIDELYYLGPLREYPKREYTWARNRPRDVGVRGEKVIDALLAATAANEQRNLKHKGRLKSFQEMIAYWLSEMGLIHNFRVEELAPGSNYWQARVTIRKGGPAALLTDVWFGVSQVLPIVTLLYYVPEGSTVILEQPEIHLHPLAQANLADLIINVATHRNVQVIIESHSEHLLLRLQRRIAEQELSADNVLLYFCSAELGSSRLERLELDVFG